MRTFLWLVIASTALAAPVPKPTVRFDPLGKGYMGVYANTGAEGEATLIIQRVVPNSAAAAAGLQANDKLLKVGSLTPKNFDDVRELIGSLRPGSKVDLVLLRNGAEVSTTITLGSRPPDFDRGIIPDEEP